MLKRRKERPARTNCWGLWVLPCLSGAGGNSKFPFNSKETYLAYRSAWKAEYKNLSAEIRVLRLADRFYQRSPYAGRLLGDPERHCLERARQLCAPEPFSLSLANFNRKRRGARATELLAKLKEAKVEAQRQYLARKAAGAAGRPTGV